MAIVTDKVGIVSCSGEDLPEGTISRIATRIVMEKLRPDDMVTICLPLFLAGSEDERAFAKVFPTITVDGCDKKCAEVGTNKYSGKPVATIVVSEIMKKYPHLKVKS
ncbi:MAG: putative zinc-binding protein, partial [Candidatus Bathyarchaeota archaeon]|nr:putative zinc-binding protein [Candidatus Bathyarchaeota archaeon]